MPDLYIGLMSGTSMDGIDAALVSFGDASLDILATHKHDYPEHLRQDLLESRNDSSLVSSSDVPELHRRVGECFRDAAIELLGTAGIDATAVRAIGSHGQTLRHEPGADKPYSLQIGDPEIIAAGTGITTIADFRTRDIELGGQGAPLAPAFHEWLFRRSGATRIVLNIGGIANITVLQGDDTSTTGFDTGPGSTLLDAWVRRHKGAPYDQDGRWSSGGSVIDDLLSKTLADPYFALPPPKSTGFEYFNLDWLEGALGPHQQPADVQATLCQLTADSIANAISMAAVDAAEVLVCGGGVHNRDLMARLQSALPDTRVGSTADVGLDPDWVEAVAFAWLARRTTHGETGNLPDVTGATRSAVLGSVHHAS